MIPWSVPCRFDRVFCTDAPSSYQVRRVCCEILVNVWAN